jgi:hypothetical protein
MIITSEIGQLYNLKYQELQDQYNGLFAKIDQAESDSLILAETVYQKALVRGPRQTDVSYDRAVSAATSRYDKINAKIVARFQSLRDYVSADQLKKTQKVDVTYDKTIASADRELVKNEKRSEANSFASFTSEISSIKLDY